ncbi:MAG: urea ABC transporter substrate-binding protein [Tepidiforma sp.]|nr:urea ABC transporter substrate-binding protein [Tepidiforma sp.]GIW15089.1 MAG: urea ABC transporter substrate-binding protein [Tepidiforma sp.]
MPADSRGNCSNTSAGNYGEVNDCMTNDPRTNYWLRKRFGRRTIVKAGAALAVTPAIASIAAACGGDDDDAPATATGGSSGSGGSSGDTIKVGILHSLSGTMAVSEVAVKDADLMAIEEINAAGGVLGKKLEPKVEDGASDWPTFAEKAKKLIQSDKVAVTFGCWTSASRKAVLPVFESNKALLYYPVQYEGLESSPYIFYTGATTNQQIVPSVEYLLEQGKKNFFLVGSDYVFPRTANKIIKAQLAASGGKVIAEEYTPLGHTEYATLIAKIKSSNADVIYNTLNGDSNVAFFKQLRDAGIKASDLTTMSVSIAEEEAAAIGGDVMEGHLVAWNYYQTVDTPENKKFVPAYQAFTEKSGKKRPTSDPVEAAYISVYLWAMAVKKAGTTDVEKVKEAMAGLEFAAPEGPVKVHPTNHHISKTVRIGKIRRDALIDEIWATKGPVEPDPYLETYPWGKEFAKEKKS